METTQGIVRAQLSATTSLKEAERIANMRFAGGVSPYLEVLDAQRQLFSAELSMAEALRDQRKAIVRVYLALGGGWSKPERPAFAGAAVNRGGRQDDPWTGLDLRTPRRRARMRHLEAAAARRAQPAAV